MCKEPLADPVGAIALLSAAAASVWFTPATSGSGTALVALSFLAASLAWYCLYIGTAIRQICDYLGIRVLSITVPATASRRGLSSGEGSATSGNFCAPLPASSSEGKEGATVSTGEVSAAHARSESSQTGGGGSGSEKDE